MEFLHSLKPRYRTLPGEVYFNALKRAVRVGKLFTLDGALPLVRTTHEWHAEHGRDGLKPTAEIRLARELFTIAGERLARELPPESAEDHADDVAAQVRQELVRLLIEPRVLRSGAGDHVSYATWAIRLAPGLGWRQCFSHPIYGLRADDGAIRIAARSEFLMGKVALLKREVIA
jgi:hypothetical protein